MVTVMVALLLLLVDGGHAEKLTSVSSVADVLAANTHRSVVFSKSYCPLVSSV
jgi:hypothetical protein